LQDPAFKFDSTNERTDTSGDLGYTTGSYKVTYTDSKTKKVVNGTGSYLTVFRKQPDGSWKAVADFSTPGS
jgi:ketosteroid isomerase-like protein